MNEKAKDLLRQNLYYFLIAIMSVGVLLVFPFLDSSTDIGWGFPTTSAGWFLYWCEKGSISATNLCIFTAFKRQALLNVRDNETYKKARLILNAVREKKSNPRSPIRYQSLSYSKKGTTIVISTICSMVAISNMVLRFSYNTLISYSVTVVMGIMFGIFAMKADEIYWTNEYYYYAIQEEKKANGADI